MGCEFSTASLSSHPVSSRDEISVTASPCRFRTTNRDARNSFRIRSYAKCRVSLVLLAHCSRVPNAYLLCFDILPHHFALFSTFLHSRKTQLLSFHAIPHSLTKTRGVEPCVSGLGREVSFFSSPLVTRRFLPTIRLSSPQFLGKLPRSDSS